MKRVVSHDVTTRVMEFAITPGDAPDLDVTRPWHRSPKVIRPDSVTVEIYTAAERHPTSEYGREPEGVTVSVSGPAVRKDGRTGSGRYTITYTDPTIMSIHHPLSEAPKWVHTILAEELPR